MNRKLLLTLFIAGISVQTFAQSVLTPANFDPLIGDKFVNHPCDTSGVVQGVGGAAVTWDFSALIPTSIDTGIAVSCSSTPDCALFPGTSFAVKSNATDLISYYRGNADSLLQNGYYISADSNAVYATAMPQFVYPFTYNTTFTSPYAGVITLGAIVAQETGTITVTCDGYGTLQLPAGLTDTGVLRVHTSQQFVDSANLFGTGVATSFDLETYSWYMPNYHSPLLTILTTTEIGGSYTNKVVSFSPIQLYNLSTPAVTTLGTSLSLFPNPVVNELNIQYNSLSAQHVRISISDIPGKEIAVIADQFIQGSQSIRYNTAALPKGVYLLSLRSATETITRKVEIQ